MQSFFWKWRHHLMPQPPNVTTRNCDVKILCSWFTVMTKTHMTGFTRQKFFNINVSTDLGPEQKEKQRRKGMSSSPGSISDLRNHWLCLFTDPFTKEINSNFLQETFLWDKMSCPMSIFVCFAFFMNTTLVSSSGLGVVQHSFATKKYDENHVSPRTFHPNPERKNCFPPTCLLFRVCPDLWSPFFI